MFLNLSSLVRASQGLFHGILYISGAQIIVDLVIFICSRILGKLVDLKKGKIWSLLSLMFIQENYTYHLKPQTINHVGILKVSYRPTYDTSLEKS